MRYATLVLVLILTGCTDTTGNTQPPDTSVSSTSTAPTSTTTTTTTPATTAPPSTTTAPAAEPAIDDASPFRTQPMPDEELPHTFADVLIGADGLLYVGAVSPTERDHPNETTFWHFDGATWQRTLLSELLPQGENAGYAQATNLVMWNGGYVGFVTAFTDEFEGVPMLLTSQDGRDWEIKDVQPGGTGSFGSIHPTPESPPWPGTIGVSSLTTTEDEIVAVGWVSSDQGSAPTVWRSADARSWSVTLLPNSDSDYEWASRVAVGDAGWLVAANGPYHTTNLLWFSPDGREWTQIGDAFLEEDAGWSIAEFAAGASALVAETTDFSGETTVTQMWRSTNGTNWAKVGEPTATTEGTVGRLVAIGSSLFRLVQTEDALTIESSEDGEPWIALADFAAPEDPWTEYYRLGSTGATVMLTRFRTTEDYTDTDVAVWFDSPVMDVILVEPDDMLNIRDGVMAETIGELAPAATGVQTTGRTDGAAGSLWAEILHDGLLGWVNSRYLTERVDDFLAMEPLTLLEEFAEEVFRNGGLIGPYVGQNGLSVGHYDAAKKWFRDDDPMQDPTVYIWGCPECSPDPGPDHHATFADWVGAAFLSAWDHGGRVIEIGGPSLGNTDRFTSLRTTVRNLHYVSVHDSGNGDYNDWKTWYVYFDVTHGELVITAIEANMWIP